MLFRSEWDNYTKNISGETRQHGLLAIKPGGSGDVTATHVLWKETKAIPEVPVPLYYNQRVYMVAGGIVTCLHAESGKLIYRGRLAPGAYFASPVTGGGRVYFASSDGIVIVIAGGDKLQVLATNDFGEPIFASPAIVGNVIYLQTANSLYAFAGEQK